MSDIYCAAKPREACAAGSSAAERLLRRLPAADERGSSLVEFALVLPVMMIVVTGMFSLGQFLNQYLQLTDAVAIAGQVLAVDRSNTTDPCADAVTAVQNAAPLLNSANLSYSFVITSGTTASPVSNSFSNKTSCKTGAAELTQGLPIQITVTYPCGIMVLTNANLMPGCTLTAQIEEDSQ